MPRYAKPTSWTSLSLSRSFWTTKLRTNGMLHCPSELRPNATASPSLRSKTSMDTDCQKMSKASQVLCIGNLGLWLYANYLQLLWRILLQVAAQVPSQKRQDHPSIQFQNIPDINRYQSRSRVVWCCMRVHSVRIFKRLQTVWANRLGTAHWLCSFAPKAIAWPSLRSKIVWRPAELCPCSTTSLKAAKAAKPRLEHPASAAA